MPIPNFDITTIRAADYYEYCCCELMEDPEFFLYEGRDVTTLPDSVQDFNQITDRLHNELRSRCSGPQIGQRLRAARKDSGLTGEKVVQLWSKQYDENNNHCTTTQATVSNHERGKVNGIRLIDLLRYCAIYSNVTSPDGIMFGCTYVDLMNNEATIKPTADPLERERMSLHQRTALYEEDMILGEQYSDHLRQLLMAMTKGHCERCGQPAPFYDKDGVPCLFLKALSEGPTLTDSVVLCPNCYMRIEVLEEPEEIEALREKASNHSLAELYKSVVK